MGEEEDDERKELREEDGGMELGQAKGKEGKEKNRRRWVCGMDGWEVDGKAGLVVAMQGVLEMEIAREWCDGVMGQWSVVSGCL